MNAPLFRSFARFAIVLVLSLTPLLSRAAPDAAGCGSESCVREMDQFGVILAGVAGNLLPLALIPHSAWTFKDGRLGHFHFGGSMVGSRWTSFGFEFFKARDSKWGVSSDVGLVYFNKPSETVFYYRLLALYELLRSNRLQIYLGAGGAYFNRANIREPFFGAPVRLGVQQILSENWQLGLSAESVMAAPNTLMSYDAGLYYFYRGDKMPAWAGSLSYKFTSGYSRGFQEGAVLLGLVL